MSDKPDMNQEEILDPNAQEELTPEQYKKARADAQAHLKGEIAYLKIEEEYQKLLANIEEHKTRRITMISQRARFYAQQQATPPEPISKTDVSADMPVSTGEDKPKRNLKVE